MVVLQQRVWQAKEAPKAWNPHSHPCLFPWQWAAYRSCLWSSCGLCVSSVFGVFLVKNPIVARCRLLASMSSCPIVSDSPNLCRTVVHGVVCVWDQLHSLETWDLQRGATICHKFHRIGGSSHRSSCKKSISMIGWLPPFWLIDRQELKDLWSDALPKSFSVFRSAPLIKQCSLFSAKIW